MALATLAKGLIGVVLPALLLIAFMVVRRDWRLLLDAKLPLGIALFLLVTAPWLILVSQATDGKWLADFLYIHWFLTVFLFFSFSDTKRQLYFVPLLPTVALLLGNYLNDLANGTFAESPSFVGWRAAILCSSQSSVSRFPSARGLSAARRCGSRFLRA